MLESYMKSTELVYLVSMWLCALYDRIASPVTENRETVSKSAATVTLQVRRNSFSTITRFVEDGLRAESASY